MLIKRILTAIVAIAVILGLLFAAPAGIVVGAIGLVILAGAWEWTGFFARPVPLWRPLLLMAVLAGIAALIVSGVLENAYGSHVVFSAALAAWVVALIVITRYPMRFTDPVVALGGVFVLLPAFLALSSVYAAGSGAVQLLALLVIVWSADIGAYFVGRRIGRVKLAPAVSPGKSWEGVIGGLAAAALTGSVIAAFVGRPVPAFLLIAVAVAAVSVIGDLTVSMFKRNAGVKDSGKLFPGHGGVLDRIDSICAAAPLYAILTRTLA